MKYFTLILALLFSVNINSQGLIAYLNTHSFNSPENKPYIEQILSIESPSINWKRLDDGALQAKIELTYIFKKDSQIVKFSKEIIKSEKVYNASEKPEFIMNMQRILLNNGKYELETRIDDLNDTLAAVVDYSEVFINFKKEDIVFSSIQALSSYKKSSEQTKFTKGELDLNPYPLVFYPQSINKLIFYCELYNTKNVLGENQDYLLSFHIKNYESNQKLPKYSSFKKKTSSEIEVILNSIDISELPSGKFEYIIELIDRENNVLATKTYFFTRSNPSIVPSFEDITSISIEESFAAKISDYDTLSLILSSLRPISSEIEKRFVDRLIEKKDILSMQQYLLKFWQDRNRENPEGAFKKYMQEVAKVEKEYATSISRGFETDRGRVYLQYGAPNVITKNYNEPNNLPYEIWQHYRYQTQGNLRFIFYTKDRSTNDFQLLHSTALGEVNNYRWRFYLRKTDTGFESIDDTGGNEDDWGSRINTNFNNPR